MAEIGNVRVERLRYSFREFLHLADVLELDDAERRAILGLTAAVWSAWREGSPPRGEAPTAAFERRLAYALPLMERMAGNDRATRSSAPQSATFIPFN